MTIALAGAAGCATGEEWQPSGEASVDHQPVLEPWFDAAAEADTEAANIVVLGDSVSEGFGMTERLQRRWVDRLQRGLRSRSDVEGCPTSPGGFHGTTSLVPAHYQPPSMPQPSVTGQPERAPRFGPGGRALDLGPGDSVSWEVDARSIDVGYRTQDDGGRLQVRVDGEEAEDGTRSTAVDGEGGRVTWSSEDLGAGSHVVTARNISPSASDESVIVTDLTPYRGTRDRCVHVLDASRSGVALHTITRTPSYLADSLSLEPDLLMVALGLNDLGAGTAPQAFGKDLDTLVEQTRDEGYDGPILLVGWFMPDVPASMPSWEGYLDQMERATRKEGVSFVDLSTVLPPVAQAPDDIYLDTVHPAAAGQPLISDALLSALTPRQEPSPTS